VAVIKYEITLSEVWDNKLVYQSVVDIGQRVASESTLMLNQPYIFLLLMFHHDFGVLFEYCTCNFE
jgi:hypothetical protein